MIKGPLYKNLYMGRFFRLHSTYNAEDFLTLIRINGIFHTLYQDLIPVELAPIQGTKFKVTLYNKKESLNSH
ncbi:hypothetical protein FHS19_004191 [Paenibacillus rhizosphaerae]|uniref:Uncharacterized protein n=1 Tax=Paenibacillus rhizosphaerae TaxID=297318 RepID=A0A839TRR3_9BACL|nr:hypothetical protein [Paenibacillus rhizosphaerae]